MVPLAGLEPALLAEPHFECGASTNFTTGARGRGAVATKTRSASSANRGEAYGCANRRGRYGGPMTEKTPAPAASPARSRSKAAPAVAAPPAFGPDRKSVLSGKRVSVRVDPGVRRIIKKQKNEKKTQNT